MTPREYQERGCQFWLNNPRTYFAVDMGLGKTLITLMALKKINKPALIIAPVRTIHTTWPDEIDKWGFDFETSIIHGKGKDQAINKKADIYISNFETIPFIYESLVHLVDSNQPLPFSVCVIDEGSMIKSPATQRFKYLKALRSVFPEYRAILSGTPAPNSLTDLWSQYFFLDDGDSLGQKVTHFRNKYFDYNRYSMRYNLKSPVHATQIYDNIKAKTFRLDEKDHIKLPNMVKNKIMLQLPGKLQKQYNDLHKEFFVEINGVNHEALNSASLSMKLRQYVQGGLYYEKEECDEKGTPLRGTTFVHSEKLKALQELLDTSPGPVLCAIQFKFELDTLRKKYPKAPHIAGGVSAVRSAELIKQWNKGEIPLLICHPGSLSHGVNLQTGGCTICWYAMTWSTEHYLQFNKRLHRSGQKETVTIHHLLMQGTIDERVFSGVAEKALNQQQLLDYLRDFTNE